MTRTLTVAEAQADLPQLIDEAANGHEIIISGSDRPAVCLARVPVSQPKPSTEKPYWVIDHDEWERRITSLRALRKRAWIGTPPTIEEILEARDEGRR